MNLYTYVGNDSVNFIDASGLYTNVTIWNGVGNGGSAFGHISVDVNGTTYSYGPGGMHIEGADAYQSRNQQFRGGRVLALDLDPEIEEALDRCLSGKQGNYNFLSNNCGDPVERSSMGHMESTRTR
jgi:hypothetical protein